MDPDPSNDQNEPHQPTDAEPFPILHLPTEVIQAIIAAYLSLDVRNSLPFIRSARLLARVSPFFRAAVASVILQTQHELERRALKLHARYFSPASKTTTSSTSASSSAADPKPSPAPRSPSVSDVPSSPSVLSTALVAQMPHMHTTTTQAPASNWRPNYPRGPPLPVLPQVSSRVSVIKAVPEAAEKYRIQRLIKVMKELLLELEGEGGEEQLEARLERMLLLQAEEVDVNKGRWMGPHAHAKFWDGRQDYWGVGKDWRSGTGGRFT